MNFHVYINHCAKFYVITEPISFTSLTISIRSEDVKRLGRNIIAIRCVVRNEETLVVVDFCAC